ncbi:MAG: CPBP family intramembrane metalloprotease [Chloroflexaceae bacterium]|nr:CPBP family intramembrane metalloprotease [Chloroflexaceae bacterium]
MNTPPPTYSAPDPHRRTAGGGFWLYLPLFAALELAIAQHGPSLGIGLYVGLLIGLSLHSSLARQEYAARLALALTLLPLTRLLTLVLPLLALPPLLGYLAVLAGSALACAVVLLQLNLRFSAVGLGLRVPVLHLLMLSSVPGLAALHFAFAAPVAVVSGELLARPPAPAAPLALLALGGVLFIGGVLEEVILRGVVQAVALPLMGRRALIFSALAGAVLHVGSSPSSALLLIGLVGWLFAHISYHTGSVLGVALLRGSTNVLYLLGLPALLGTPDSPALLVALAPLGMPTALLVLVLLVLMSLLLAWVLVLFGYLCARPTS